MPKFKPAIDEEWLSISKLNKPLALGDQLPFYIYPLKAPVELESELNWLDYKELGHEKWLWNDVETEMSKNFEEKTYIDTGIAQKNFYIQDFPYTISLTNSIMLPVISTEVSSNTIISFTP